jgi:hypothetical protein
VDLFKLVGPGLEVLVGDELRKEGPEEGNGQGDEEGPELGIPYAVVLGTDDIIMGDGPNS